MSADVGVASSVVPLRRAARLAGLLNSGALCYLNSILQSLFMTREVRRMLLRWRPPTDESQTTTDDAKSGAPTSLESRLRRSVPFQLQLLFARLLLSRARRVIDTRDLTHSFGWSQSENMRQHDAQELMRVLFTALEREWTTKTPSTLDSATPATAADPTISSLYTGQFEDALTCSTCSSRRVRADPFQDLAVSVAGFRGLTESLAAFVQAERIEGLRCESPLCAGEKRDATKRLTLATLPAVLTFHLKRFVFDFNLMQRIKVNDAFECPKTIDMAPFMNDGTGESDDGQTKNGDTRTPSTQYQLFAILMHSGVAQGGHYYAYLRSLSDGEFREFNDAHVWELPGGIDAAIKLARGGDGTQKNGASAYMLMYRRVDHGQSPSPTDATIDTCSDEELIHPDVRALVASEDAKYELEAAVAEQERRLLDIAVHFHAFPIHRVRVDLGTSLRAMTQTLLDHYRLTGRRVEDARLRKYDPALQWASDVYSTDSDDLTLEQAGFAKQNQVQLELKQPNEEWPPYTADTLPLRCAFVHPGNVSELVEESLRPIVTPDVLQLVVSTTHRLSDLRRTIVDAATGSVPSIANQRILVMDEQRCEVLRDEEAPLSSFGLFPGRFIYVEHALEEEILRPTFDRLRCQIEICYNLPSEAAATSAAMTQPEYNQKLFVSRHDTLGEVRVKMAAALGIDVDSFRLARTHTAPQLKDDAETLAQLQLVDQSGLFVSLGRPLKKDEVQVKFHLYQDESDEAPTADASAPAAASTPSRFLFLFDLPVRGDLLIRDLKTTLLDFLHKKRPHLTEAGGNEWRIRHMRLREKKGAQATRVLEDARSIQECAAVNKSEDVFEIAIQRLDAPEVWGKDQMLVQLQQWNPRTQRLGVVQDLVTRRNISVAAMRQQIYKMMHQGQAYEGPPISTPADDATTAAASLSSVPTADPSAPTDTDTPSLPPPASSSAPILLSKGKLTSRMKKSDVLRLSWLSRDAACESKLLRNALSIRPGELMLFQEEPSATELEEIAAAKEKKKSHAASAVAPTASGDVVPASGVRKPWQRGPTTTSGASRLRKPAARSSTIVTPARAPVERGLYIGWELEERQERWLAEETRATLAKMQVTEDKEPTAAATPLHTDHAQAAQPAANA